MYLDFFGLTEFPFAITPDPRYLFLSRHHREAFDYLSLGIQIARKGWIEKQDCINTMSSPEAVQFLAWMKDNQPPEQQGKP